MKAILTRAASPIAWLAIGVVAAFSFGLPRGSDAVEPRATQLVGWAIVKGNGTLQGHRHVIANHRDGVGQYRIVFDRKVHRCTYSTSFRDHAENAFVFPTPGQQASLTITTFTANTGAIDGTFDLQVFCG